MYLYHFGLKELPFSLTPNTSYYLDLPSHHEALDVLMTALKLGEGFIKVTGEVGVGKTLLCRKLLKELPDAFCTAYIPDPYLSPQEMRWSLAHELGMEVPVEMNPIQLAQQLQEHLLELCMADKRVVLVIDEAQALPDETLEALRLITNLETESRKLVQVVLLGQPELNERLKERHLRQLRQRISFSYDLRPLEYNEVIDYVHHRLAVAGYVGAPILDDSGLDLLASGVSGIPRIINIVCHKALLLAYGEGRRSVSKDHIREALQDTDGSEYNKDWQKITFGTVLTGAVGSLAFWYWLGR
ncbi:ExeA family protein [Algicola sagamiensis]|uniref:ExeA family protein n=1 Tax=Algicola sagamiensis TaxID=163869 RepID=UPI00036C75CF|nr:AAA family ATPase [Algicola sagamiensis]